ncbi:MAG: chorismate synthase [Flavobacteriales bacterium]|nr:chorismate synthase [Flavobacteriales bacterium]
MPQNTLGHILRLTTFGESHGPAIGGILDGCPAGLPLDMDAIQRQLDRRRPGQSHITTQRKESDTVHFVSGLFEGKTQGTPIAFIIHNEDAKSKDYSHIKDSYRPSHADFVFEKKYATRDYRGGGRSSARVTAPIVAAGAIAQQLLAHQGVDIRSWVRRVHHIETDYDYSDLDLDRIDSNPVRCPDEEVAAQMLELIEATRKEGDTLGGAIACRVAGVPAGWGEPVFQKLHAQLAQAMMGINAAKAFEIGSGMAGTFDKGSEQNDVFIKAGEEIRTASNNSGGIQGGISNGEHIYFQVHFKPIATLMRDQDSVDTEGNPVTVKGKGRHDPCVLPRAVPIVDALAALVLADAMLMARTDQL